MGSDSSKVVAERVKVYISGRDRLMYLLEAEVLEASPGYARVAITVEDKHLNAAEVCHSGVLFSLSNTAFALAGNSHGHLALALEVSISFLRVARLGERVAAKAREEYLGRRTGFYIITVTNQEGKKIALVKGTSFCCKSLSPPGERIR